MGTKNILNRDFEYFDVCGNSLLSECLKDCDQVWLQEIKSDQEMLTKLKMDLKRKIKSEETKIRSGFEPSAASKVNAYYYILYTVKPIIYLY